MMAYLSHFENELNQLCLRLYRDYPSELANAIVYSLSVGGKRFRPQLVYATAETFGLSFDKVDAAALAVECIHTYSLIHDDLPDMDDDDLRRGHPTCHVKFGNASAILAGDALQSVAFMLLSHDVSQMMQAKILTKAAIQMVAGQALDIAGEHSDHLTIEQLKNIHRLKTGELINAAILMGVANAKVEFNVTAKLSIIAYQVGLHYQIIDDILDVCQTSIKLGKPSGSDIALGKTTYVSLLGLDSAREEAKRLEDEIKQGLSILRINDSPLAKLLTQIIKRKY